MKKILAILSMAIFFAAIVPNASAQDKKHVHKADSTKTTATTTKSTPAKSTADASKKTGTSATTSTTSKTKK